MPRKTDVTLTEQTTAPVDFALLSDVDGDGEAETGINLSAIDHIELWMRDNRGTVSSFTSAGTAAKLSFPAGYAAAGSVQWAPGTADLQSAYSPYNYNFKVFPSGSTWYYVPEDSENTIHVRPRIG